MGVQVICGPPGKILRLAPCRAAGCTSSGAPTRCASCVHEGGNNSSLYFGAPTMAGRARDDAAQAQTRHRPCIHAEPRPACAAALERSRRPASNPCSNLARPRARERAHPRRFLPAQPKGKLLYLGTRGGTAACTFAGAHVAVTCLRPCKHGLRLRQSADNKPICAKTSRNEGTSCALCIFPMVSGRVDDASLFVRP